MSTLANPNEYNDWKNKETWLVNVWYGNMIESCVLDGGDADTVEQMVIEIAHSARGNPIPTTDSLLQAFIDMCFADVDWEALVEHHKE